MLLDRDKRGLGLAAYDPIRSADILLEINETHWLVYAAMWHSAHGGISHRMPVVAAKI